MRLVAGEQLLQALRLDELYPAARTLVRSASVGDPFVLLHLANGHGLVLQGDPVSRTLALVPGSIQVRRVGCGLLAWRWCRGRYR